MYTDLEEAGQASKTSCHKGRIIGDVVRAGLARPGKEDFTLRTTWEGIACFQNKGTICSHFLLKRALTEPNGRCDPGEKAVFREGCIALHCVCQVRDAGGRVVGTRMELRNMSDLSSCSLYHLTKVLLSNAEGHTHTLGIPGLNHSLHIGNGGHHNVCPWPLQTSAP